MQKIESAIPNDLVFCKLISSLQKFFCRLFYKPIHISKQLFYGNNNYDGGSSIYNCNCKHFTCHNSFTSDSVLQKKQTTRACFELCLKHQYLKVRYSEDKLTSALSFKLSMAVFNVHVIIENKPGISDPEGDTILNDLVLKGTNANNAVSKIKTARMLKFTIDEENKKTARDKIQTICDDLRIYNPMVSQVTVDVLDS